MDEDLLDPAYVSDRLSRPPFVTLPGVVNVRDLGSYPTECPGYITKPGLIYRSGEVSFITEEGKQRLRDLGITTVYDLRSDTEMEKYETPIPTIEGVQVPEAMTQRFELYASGKIESFMTLYSQILDHAGPSFGVVLRHIRDLPQQGCLFHCTAGKDRTGVLAALLLKLAGVNDGAIVEDYALTRIGREPVRPMIMERLAKMPYFATNSERAMNMLSSRPETMVAFLQMLRDRYGGVEVYLRNTVGLTDEDVATIRRNLTTPLSRS
ncbi:protein-tyrosine phosphatase-like protein [Epithele typhae]|uniref:protein-tyrosine phosphatase-like protein n=1 Tax=Epithele typhae TaxID=378194 RepID=UPI0020072A60|nr:protein-tyrosine phosphatase-like protein [Epithele typhae]KAH9943222.1 protein-tyrosine phosphatase-like protein [Epithele typhae]